MMVNLEVSMSLLAPAKAGKLAPVIVKTPVAWL